MLRTITIVILSLGLIGTVYWGYKEHEEKNALLIHAENNYQRSFHELTHHMDLLHDQIGTALAMSSNEKLSPQFVEIWRISHEALTNASQLPLSLLPIHKTQEFLSKIGDFTYKKAIRNLDDDPLKDEEIETLEKLYEQAANIKDELRKMQHKVLADNLRWMDVELALATQDEPMDSTIIDGFTTVENQMNEFTMEMEGSKFLQATDKPYRFEAVTGKEKSEEDIRDFTKQFFDIPDEVNIDISSSGDGADLPFYSVFYEDGKRVYMDITKKGGHPLYILVDRPIEETKLSLNDGLIKAEKYLQRFGYEDMVLLQSQQFDEEGVYKFLHVQDDVRIYPDAITVKVALDNGDITGINAKEYLLNHHKRNIAKPKIKLEEAKSKVNKNIKIHEEHLAIIENDVNEEVLVYEFLGEMNDETYRIFINAENGKEEKVEKLTNTEMNFDIQI